MSKKFYTFGPFEAYKQSQTVFRSHFDLYTAKKFGNRHKDNVTDEDLRSALIEAKSLEERFLCLLIFLFNGTNNQTNLQHSTLCITHTN